MSAADVDIGPPAGDNDNDNASIQTADQQAAAQQRANAATPDEDEVAQAMAEVAAMEGQGQGQGRGQNNQAGEEALMGAAGGEDGVAGFEVTDESGELVKQRFLGFLGN
jgi:hypothetical protein